jgi:hypothetical protein
MMATASADTRREAVGTRVMAEIVPAPQGGGYERMISLSGASSWRGITGSTSADGKVAS